MPRPQRVAKVSEIASQNSFFILASQKAVRSAPYPSSGKKSQTRGGQR